jgi:hypothetical protein
MIKVITHIDLREISLMADGSWEPGGIATYEYRATQSDRMRFRYRLRSE